MQACCCVAGPQVVRPLRSRARVTTPVAVRDPPCKKKKKKKKKERSETDVRSVSSANAYVGGRKHDTSSAQLHT